MIRFACGTCKEILLVPARHAGRKGKCPNCGTINRVPMAGEFPNPPGSAVAEPVGMAPAATAPPVAVASTRAVEARLAEPRLLELREQPPAAVPTPVQNADVNPVADGSRRMVEVNPLDDAGMAPALKLLIVLGILAVIVLGVWVVFYLLIWSQIRLST